jgi:N-acetylmuramic acid 6-phosphate etherase
LVLNNKNYFQPSDNTPLELDKMDTSSILYAINQEDHSIAASVSSAISSITHLVEFIYKKLLHEQGRLFYFGAGTSGRLGILDASECPPTFGVSYDMVIGLIAGGDTAIRRAVEFSEDDPSGSISEFEKYKVQSSDVVIGISASGTTPYVLGGLQYLSNKGISTACIVNQLNSPIAKASTYPIEVITGPEIILGSTRMKAGTSQKMVLNMISTAVMIKLGKVKGNKMVDMMIANQKLKKRGIDMIMDELGVSHQEASLLLEIHGNVRKVIESRGNT